MEYAFLRAERFVVYYINSKEKQGNVPKVQENILNQDLETQIAVRESSYPEFEIFSTDGELEERGDLYIDSEGYNWVIRMFLGFFFHNIEENIEKLKQRISIYNNLLQEVGYEFVKVPIEDLYTQKEKESYNEKVEEVHGEWGVLKVAKKIQIFYCKLYPSFYKKHKIKRFEDNILVNTDNLKISCANALEFRKDSKNVIFLSGIDFPMEYYVSPHAEIFVRNKAQFASEMGKLGIKLTTETLDIEFMED